MERRKSVDSADDDYDVVVVGGGPAGCAAGVCTGQYGLDTLILDRGSASLDRCAFLENYLGFPGGIDVETFAALCRDHATEAGCTVLDETVEAVERLDDGFRVVRENGRSAHAPRVVAATTIDADYLRGLDDEAALFTTTVRRDGEHQRFDGDYADDDGRTPIEGLFVAGGLADRGDLALLAAAHGMRVGRTVVADVRREQGYWEEAAEHMDWLRRRPAGDDAAMARETWHRWFDYHRLPDDHDLDPERVERVREREIDRVVAAQLTRTEASQRADRGHRRLAAHLDEAALLDSVDDDRIRAYLDGKQPDDARTHDTFTE